MSLICTSSTTKTMGALVLAGWISPRSSSASRTATTIGTINARSWSRACEDRGCPLAYAVKPIFHHCGAGFSYLFAASLGGNLQKIWGMVLSRAALAKILEAYVAKELQPYVRTFEPSYYEHMFRLRGL